MYHIDDLIAMERGLLIVHCIQIEKKLRKLVHGQKFDLDSPRFLAYIALSEIVFIKRRHTWVSLFNAIQMAYDVISEEAA